MLFVVILAQKRIHFIVALRISHMQLPFNIIKWPIVCVCACVFSILPLWKCHISSRVREHERQPAAPDEKHFSILLTNLSLSVTSFSPHCYIGKADMLTHSESESEFLYLSSNRDIYNMYLYYLFLLDFGAAVLPVWSWLLNTINKNKVNFFSFSFHPKVSFGNS